MDACPEVTNDAGEDEGQGTADDAADQPGVEESYGVGLVADDVISPRGSVQSGASGRSQTAIADDVEMNHRDEESPKQSARDADERAETTTLTKPEKTSTKTGNSRTKNASKCADKKVWKPGGSLVALPTQQNRKEGAAGSRGKPNRQGNASVPPRLPPISVSAMVNSDRRKQQAAAGEAARLDSIGRGVGVIAAPGHIYKCSATACVTVLPQSPENTQHPSTNGGDELSNGSVDFSNRNRKYSGY